MYKALENYDTTPSVQDIPQETIDTIKKLFYKYEDGISNYLSSLLEKEMNNEELKKKVYQYLINIADPILKDEKFNDEIKTFFLNMSDEIMNDERFKNNINKFLNNQLTTEIPIIENDANNFLEKQINKYFWIIILLIIIFLLVLIFSIINFIIMLKKK